ncbi:hypothetical protein GALMADRAFT_602515 [Galerina marginata CBS 339.88]|uniref:Peptidase C14 caspase domain-containing protein n=1 Tax=Galerina marginata (strain CBS 339.88) TaxID=685588 RepID=A0A067ST81_GALM3|nr:hypothetical protein GALMADRAFT_602515 [Galerina marginata CBS 339.88]
MSIATQRPLLNLFVLIIAIDCYESGQIPNLRFAVSDGLLFRDYLRHNLKVPEAQIHLLLNKSASRSGIIDGFLKLKADERIRHGDPILIYYAGHGSEMLAPPEWEAGSPGGNIQLIVPQDFCLTRPKQISGIPDRTISALLEKISEVKGDNITVIFDCCHAASGTRALSDSRVRSVYLGSRIKGDLDKDIWGKHSRVTLNPSKAMRGALTTHMLLAASSADQEARETNGSGHFTAALLKLFRTVPLDHLRYRDILSRMDQIKGQDPQCEGVHQGRLLFSAAVPSLGPFPSYPVTLKRASTEDGFILPLGTAHGVSTEAEFAVHRKTDTALETPIGHLTVGAVTNFTATATSLSAVPSCMHSLGEALVIQTKAGRKDPLPICFVPCEAQRDFVSSSTLVDNIRSDSDLQNIVFVDTPDRALLDVTVVNNEAVLRVQDKDVLQHGFDPQSNSIRAPLDQLARVLRNASVYYSELRRVNQALANSISIQIEFFKLEAVRSPFPDVDLPDLLPVGRNLHHNNAVELTAEPDSPYGIKLTNTGSRDLYPSVFYFDNSDLSIATVYDTPSSGPYVLDVPLKKGGGTLAIGYGSGGCSPLHYTLKNGQNISVGFLKIFVFTRPIAPSTVPELYPSGHTWGTIVFPIVCRRRQLTQSAQTTSKMLQEMGSRGLTIDRPMPFRRHPAFTDKLGLICFVALICFTARFLSQDASRECKPKSSCIDFSNNVM